MSSLTERKKQSNYQQTKGVGFVQAESPNEILDCGDKMPDPCFEPFIFDGLVSLTADPSDQKPVRILRDTGGSQFIVPAVLILFCVE